MRKEDVIGGGVDVPREFCLESPCTRTASGPIFGAHLRHGTEFSSPSSGRRTLIRPTPLLNTDHIHGTFRLVYASTGLQETSAAFADTGTLEPRIRLTAPDRLLAEGVVVGSVVVQFLAGAELGVRQQGAHLGVAGDQPSLVPVGNVHPRDRALLLQCVSAQRQPPGATYPPAGLHRSGPSAADTPAGPPLPRKARNTAARAASSSSRPCGICAIRRR
jgi:hypothetical protein